MHHHDTTRTIPITQGYEAIVDTADYERLSQYKWHVKRTKYGAVYAQANEYYENKPRTVVLMHRLVIDAKPGEIVDHINRNPLDNRRSNLRIVSRQESNINRKMRSENTSGYRGVGYYKRSRRWVAKITVNKKNLHLGYFDSPEDAARAYDEAARQHFGEFAETNFPPKTWAASRTIPYLWTRVVPW